MKRIIRVILVIVAIGACGAGAWWGFNQVFTDSVEWYVQVDADRVSKAEDNANGFDWHYDLPAANAEGDVEQLGFDTSRELRDGAYLKVETLALRGVVSWEEVAPEDVPAAALDVLSGAMAGA